MAMDPTRTTMLRKKWIADINKRIRKLKGEITEFLVADDAFGLSGPEKMAFNKERQKYIFQTDPQKIESYKTWFQERVDAGVLSTDNFGDPWTDEYVHSAYRKGAVRAYTDVRREALAEDPMEYEGGKSQFLRDAFASPEAISKIQMVATRAFDQLKGFTAQMSQATSRVLSDGIAHGWGAGRIARELNSNIDSLTRKRAWVIARTETIHAHAEGQLDSFERLGIDDISLDVEWSTAGDDRVCPQCAPREGEILTLKEARGQIPYHPNCRCAWKPATEEAKKKHRMKMGEEKQAAEDAAFLAEKEKEKQAEASRPEWEKKAEALRLNMLAEVDEGVIQDVAEYLTPEEIERIRNGESVRFLLEKKYEGAAKDVFDNTNKWIAVYEAKGDPKLIDSLHEQIGVAARQQDRIREAIHKLSATDTNARVWEALRPLEKDRADSIIKGGGVFLKGVKSSSKAKKMIRQADKFLSSFVEKGTPMANKQEVLFGRPAKKTDRANCIPLIPNANNPDYRSFILFRDSSNVNTLVHEMGHHLESVNPSLNNKILAVYRERTANDKSEWLGGSYKQSEVWKKDHWQNYGWREYTGKDYDASRTSWQAAGINPNVTEVTSMAVQRLYEDPLDFAKKDPKIFDIITGALRGFY